MSIGKAQAAALAEGFLDSVGSGSPDDLEPRETFTEIILIAGEFVEACQNNLNNSGSNASGKLSASLVANEPTIEGKALKIDVSMNFYGLFVNKGVQGTKSGASKAGYKFKSDNPPTSMVEAIAEWQKGGKQRTSNVNSKKTVSKTESKNSSIGALDSAYATARSIMQKGLKATGFIDKATISTRSKIADRLGAAFKLDLIDAITGENLQ